jgi:hypothetical protein
MKIALCISGQPRGLVGGCTMLKEKLIAPSNITDIFIHNWYHPSMEGRPFDSTQPYLDNRLGRWMPESDKYLDSQLNPITAVYEYQEDLSQFNHLSNVEGRARQKGLASMFLSAFKANELKKQYEEKNNFKYDVVIRARIDHTYYSNINIRELYNPAEKDAVFVPRNHQHMRDNHFLVSTSGIKYSSSAETFMFGSSENIDKATQVYNNFEQIYTEIYPENFAEQYIGYQVTGASGMRVLSVDAPYDIYRGE